MTPNKTLDELFSYMPTGSLDRAVLNNLRGVNHLQTPGMLPSQRDMPGYTFFVRPQLNMQRENIRNVRKLSMLLNNQPVSMQTYMRCMLDPRLGHELSFKGESGKTTKVDCPLLDNQFAFIPILTNNINTISGWPSISVPTFSAKAGLYNESYTMVDGRVENSETYDLSVQFRNTRGNPIFLLFYVWSLYMGYVFEGKLVPYLDFISENEIDYNTRIYRITLDTTKSYITGMTACTACIPVGLPIGELFDIPGDKPYIESYHDVSMTFKCMGVDYFDPILVKEFNDCVKIFNPDMRDTNRKNNMMRIPNNFKQYFNYLGYPRINANTAELEWWLPTDTYLQQMRFIQYMQIPEASPDYFEGD